MHGSSEEMKKRPDRRQGLNGHEEEKQRRVNTKR